MRDALIGGIGMGLTMVPMLIAVQSAVPRSELGMATSMIQFFRTVGGAIGLAVMGAVMAWRLGAGASQAEAAAQRLRRRPAGLRGRAGLRLPGARRAGRRTSPGPRCTASRRAWGDRVMAGDVPLLERLAQLPAGAGRGRGRAHGEPAPSRSSDPIIGPLFGADEDGDAAVNPLVPLVLQHLQQKEDAHLLRGAAGGTDRDLERGRAGRGGGAAARLRPAARRPAAAAAEAVADARLRRPRTASGRARGWPIRSRQDAAAGPAVRGATAPRPPGHGRGAAPSTLDPAVPGRTRRERSSTMAEIPAGVYATCSTRRSFAHVATVGADGAPQVTPVWIDFDGQHIRFNTARGRVKDNNLERITADRALDPGSRQPVPLRPGARPGDRGDGEGRRRAHRRAGQEVPRAGPLSVPPAGRGAGHREGHARARAEHGVARRGDPARAASPRATAARSLFRDVDWRYRSTASGSGSSGPTAPARPRSAASWPASRSRTTGSVSLARGTYRRLPAAGGRRRRRAAPCSARRSAASTRCGQLEREMEEVAAALARPTADRRAHRRATASCSIASRRSAAIGSRRRPSAILGGLGFRADELHAAARPSSPAAGACARRWPGCCCCGPPRCCSWTSRPTTSIWTRSGGWRTSSAAYDGTRGRRLPRPVLPEPHGHLDRRPRRRRARGLPGRLRRLPGGARGAAGAAGSAARATRPSASPRSSVSSSGSATRRPRRGRCRAASRCSTRSSGIEVPGAASRQSTSRFPQPPRTGRRVATLTDVHKAYGDNVVYTGVDVRGGARRSRRAGRRERRGQVDAAQDPGRRAAVRAGRAHARRPRRRALLRAAPARRARCRRAPCSRSWRRWRPRRPTRGCAPSWARSSSRATRSRRRWRCCPAARRRGWPWPRCWSGPPRCCASTSRRTISISPRVKCSSRRWPASRARSSSSRTIGTSSTGSPRVVVEVASGVLTSYLGVLRRLSRGQGAWHSTGRGPAVADRPAGRKPSRRHGANAVRYSGRAAGERTGRPPGAAAGPLGQPGRAAGAHHSQAWNGGDP